MRKRLILFTSVLGALTLLLILQASVLTGREELDTGGMREAATVFLQSLDEAGRAKAVFEFDDEERYNWHYVPRERKGLPLEEMTLEQRRAAHDLLRAALSSQGYVKATSIMRLEEILRELENDPVRRNPERYYVSIFGAPSADTPWGWRLEGHHLSLNYSSVTDELVAVTPAFMGTNPAEVRTGPYAGLRILGAEEDMARTLLHSLSDAQRQQAIIAVEAPGDIITTNQRKALLETFDGLPASEMTPEQRAMLVDIVREYTHNMRHDVAHEQMEKIEAAGIDKLYFAWAGGTERHEPHYYRIHGPTVLFEYDNTQNEANHAHAVWRDLTNDFGEDLLARHYQEADHSHGH